MDTTLYETLSAIFDRWMATHEQTQECLVADTRHPDTLTARSAYHTHEMSRQVAWCKIEQDFAALGTSFREWEQEVEQRIAKHSR